MKGIPSINHLYINGAAKRVAAFVALKYGNSVHGAHLYSDDSLSRMGRIRPGKARAIPI